MFPEAPTPARLLPNPLDVAYAVFANDQAAPLLRGELERYRYAPQLEAMRALVEAHEPAFWGQNLYNLRLAAARGLSPRRDDVKAGRPTVMGMEGWRRRLLNAQLASWAELRHDTILYAKQSYSAGFSCEFPDAYVDPYPETWAALAAFARRGEQIADALSVPEGPWAADRVRDYFVQMQSIVGTLGKMAEHELAGKAFTDAQMAFINQAVRLNPGCGGPPTLDGWFARLYFDPQGAAEQDPVVADVHTQPTDEDGNPVGRVLHVGTGLPRLMVVTANTCNGPRAYAGAVSSYYEHITENFDRLNDARWAKLLEKAPPADVSWMSVVLAGP